MIVETGKVVSVEADSLWVETIQQSTCGSCEAESVCGQGLMARFFLGSRFLQVFLEGRNPDSYQSGDQITIGIPEGVVVKISFLAYLLPLLSLVLGAGLGNAWGGDLYSLIGAVSGLVAGAALVRWIAGRYMRNRRYQPVLVDNYQPLIVE